MKLHRLIVTLVAVAALALPVTSALAATAPLASFTELAASKDFHYLSNTGGTDDATFSATTSALLVPQSPALGFGPVVTTLTITGIAHDPTIWPVNGYTGVPGELLDENVAITSLSFKVGATNYLSMTALGAAPGLPGGSLTGNLGADSASIVGSDSLATPNRIVYSSDFATMDLNANPPDYATNPARGYSIALVAIQSLPTNTGLDVEDAAALDYKHFVATLAGDFSFTPTVPEPGALAMFMGLGISGSLFVLRRRR